MISAIIQARMGSTRLPGKVLKNINGMSLLEYQIERITKSKHVKNIIVATSTNKKDDEIEKICIKKNVDFYRGSENDVLSRFYECSKIYNVKTIVRLTADCPLIDPIVIDKVIDTFIENNTDYSSNTVPPDTSFWPDGSDVEVFSFGALERAFKKATKPEDREHVTFFFWKNKLNGFKINQLKNNEDWSNYRYTVDYPNDFDVFKMLDKEITKKKIFGHVNEIVDILKNRPDIREINKNYYFGIGWNK